MQNFTCKFTRADKRETESESERESEREIESERELQAEVDKTRVSGARHLLLTDLRLMRPLKMKISSTARP